MRILLIYFRYITMEPSRVANVFQIKTVYSYAVLYLPKLHALLNIIAEICKLYYYAGKSNNRFFT